MLGAKGLEVKGIRRPGVAAGGCRAPERVRQPFACSLQPRLRYTPAPGLPQHLPQPVENLWKNSRAGRCMTEVWSSILKRIEGKLDPKELKTWFAPTRQLELDASGSSPVLTVAVPSRMFADWIESRHGELLAREAEAEGLPGLEIRFESGSTESASPAAAAAPARAVVAHPRFTFDTFVVGSSNQFAHAAARAVAETPSRSYNPLFLY